MRRHIRSRWAAILLVALVSQSSRVAGRCTNSQAAKRLGGYRGNLKVTDFAVWHGSLRLVIGSRQAVTERVTISA
jgi:hypothetical protein